MRLRYISTLMALTLVGCGGGASSPPPSASALSSSSTQPPSAAPTPSVQGAVLQSAVASAYATGSSQAIGFKKLNDFRASMGLGPLNQDTNIDIAAKNHQAYVTTYQSGATAHVEVVGNPGFTGVNPVDRLVAAGYQTTFAGEVIAFSLVYPSTDYTPIDNLSNTVYHRAVMMTQGFTDVGFAPESQNSPLYLDMAAKKRQLNAGDYVGVYPADKQVGVFMSHSLESPNPFYQEMDMSQSNMCTKTSSPISIASEASTTLSVTSFTVTEEGQPAPLDTRLITRATSTQDGQYLTPNVAFIIGRAPFKPNTKYIVRFVGTATGTVTGAANGLGIDKSWSFTTGSYKRGCP